MTHVMTTKMSSKGQVVLPEALRETYGWGSGTAFTIVTYRGAIIMRPLHAPTDEELAKEFDGAFLQSRESAAKAGMTTEDIALAISDVRQARRLHRARR